MIWQDLCRAALAAALVFGAASSGRAAAQTPATPPAAAAAPAAEAAPADDKKSVARTAAEQLVDRRKARPRERSNTCATCHATLPEANLRSPAERYAGSVHRDPRIGCVGCHGGDPEDPTVRAHAPKGFVARPALEVATKICGGCHANAHFIRELDPKLGVDQATLYGLSLHAKLVAQGDPNAPTCTSCHGSHDVTVVSSPESPAHRRNVAKLCGKCHADKGLMHPYGTPTDQVEKWQRSQHAEALAAGSPQAPSCTGCHNAHAGEVVAGATARVCGVCHQDQAQYVRQSPHAKPFEQLGMSDCTPCHGQHEIVRTSWLAGLAPDSACSRCHSKDERPRKVAEELSALLRDARVKGDEARAAVANATAQRLFVRGASAALDELSTEELKLRTQVHTLDPERLRVLSRGVFETAQRTQKLAEAAQAERGRQRQGYFVALGLAGLLLVLLVAKVVQLEQRRRRSGA